MNATTAIPFPAICVEMRITERDGVPVVNSRDVAAVFQKAHDKVMRDIEALELSPDLATSWYLPASYRDTLNREQSSLDMTRDGFMFLCMGWTGPRAASIKVRYIKAFNAMEAELNRGDRLPLKVLVNIDSGVRDLHRQQQFTHAVCIETLDATRRTEAIANRIDETTNHLPLSGDFSDPIKRIVMDCLGPNALCRCCNRELVTDDTGNRLPNAQFDHFYGRSDHSIKNCWLVSAQCNASLKDVNFRRFREARFNAWQLDLEDFRRDGSKLQWREPPSELEPEPRIDTKDPEPDPLPSQYFTREPNEPVKRGRGRPSHLSIVREDIRQSSLFER